MIFTPPRTRLLTLVAKALLLAVPLFLISTYPSAAAKLKTIYALPCGGGDCPEGAGPYYTFIVDAAGNLYGTTLFGAAHANGGVFEMVKSAHGYKYERLYDFCAMENCTDGGQASSSLIMDVNGNLYGTTISGGANGDGNIYKLTPSKGHKPWKIATLYDFCSESCASHAFPAGGLAYKGQQAGALYDGSSPLFGAIWGGGAADQGAIYRLDFSGRKKKPQESIVYSFCSQADCADGSNPSGTPLIDALGNLYGSTSNGGSELGVVYELTAVNGTFSETVLGEFCASGFACVQQPQGRLSMDSQGNLYGASMFGSGQDEGAIFKVVPNGANSTGTVLYTFCPDLGTCANGGSPNGDLAIAADGTIYGTTSQGGKGHWGTVFSLSSGVEKPLYSFCIESVNTCTDGYLPLAGVIFDGSGNILGATGGGLGGPAHGGTIFMIKISK